MLFRYRLLAFLVLLPVPCAAADDAPLWIEPVAAEAVDDATLDATRGRFFGANMLVGVRIDLVSSLATAQGGQASAQGSLQLTRNANGGFDVQVDTRSGASGTQAVSTSGVAVGGDGLSVNGIGQVTQIAGDGNRMGNLAVIRVVDSLQGPTDFNGSTESAAQAGTLTARVSFAEGGLQLGLTAPGVSIGQRVGSTAGGGELTQFGRIAGDGFNGSNALSMQILTAPLTAAELQDLGIRQALQATSGLGR